MRILCSKCGEGFDSLIIDQSIAWKECIERSMKHVKYKHPEMFKAMGEAQQIAVPALSLFMHLNEFVMIPENNEFGKKSYEQTQELVMVSLGFDPDGDDEEEDVEDNEETEESEPESTPIEKPTPGQPVPINR